MKGDISDRVAGRDTSIGHIAKDDAARSGRSPYYNCRLGLPQRGLFAPFNVNILAERTTLFLGDLPDQGIVPIDLDPAAPQWINDLNCAAALKA